MQLNSSELGQRQLNVFTSVHLNHQMSAVVFIYIYILYTHTYIYKTLCPLNANEAGGGLGST